MNAESAETTAFAPGLDGSVALINATLPQEILVCIFRLLTYTIDDKSRRWYFSPLWIRLAHVCQYWRTLIHNTPILWTNISFLNKNITNLMLKRSRNASFVLHYDNRLVASPDPILLLALNELGRVRIVNVNSTSVVFHQL